MATAREAPPQSYSRTLITASHILHNHNILDAYGHISVRHPNDPNVFIMPRNIAPATLRSEFDLVEYQVSDASPVAGKAAPGGYAERYIHSEIYKMYVSVQSVVHSHAAAVMPFANTSVPLRPCIHIAGFLGSSPPIFDISSHYTTTDKRNLLVTNTHLGESLASCFHGMTTSAGGSLPAADAPTRTVVLMRGHGMTVVGESIEEAVLRAVYTAENANVLNSSLLLSASSALSQGVLKNSVAGRHPPGKHNLRADSTDKAHTVHYLHDDELSDTAEISRWSLMRPWNLWVKQVELECGFYRNEAK